MNDEPLSHYTRDLFLRLAAMEPGDGKAVEFAIQQTINKAVADERERCAKVAANWRSSLRPGTPARRFGHEEAARDIATAIRDCTAVVPQDRSP